MPSVRLSGELHMTPDPRRIDAIEEYALASCVDGHPRLSMQRVLDILCDRGWIDEQASPTQAGYEAHAQHVEALKDAACANNIVPCLKEDAIVALGKLVDGLELSGVDEEALRGHEGLAWLPMRGLWAISATGRRAYRLALARTFA